MQFFLVLLMVILTKIGNGNTYKDRKSLLLCTFKKWTWKNMVYSSFKEVKGKS